MDLDFIFEVIAKNPPSILFVLAAFALVIASATNNPQAWQWVSNFFWAGVILQVLWLAFKYLLWRFFS